MRANVERQKSSTGCPEAMRVLINGVSSCWCAERQRFNRPLQLNCDGRCHTNMVSALSANAITFHYPLTWSKTANSFIPLYVIILYSHQRHIVRLGFRDHDTSLIPAWCRSSNLNDTKLDSSASFGCRYKLPGIRTSRADEGSLNLQLCICLIQPTEHHLCQMYRRLSEGY